MNPFQRLDPRQVVTRGRFAYGLATEDVWTIVRPRLDPDWHPIDQVLEPIQDEFLGVLLDEDR